MTEQSPNCFQPSASDVAAILASPSTSSWLRVALQTALQRDPVDAANDAEVLADVLANRRADLLAKTSKGAGGGS